MNIRFHEKGTQISKREIDQVVSLYRPRQYKSKSKTKKDISENCVLYSTSSYQTENGDCKKQLSWCPFLKAGNVLLQKVSLTEHKHNETFVWSVWFVEYIVCPVCFQLGEDIDILSAEKEAKGSHLPLELYLRLPGNLCFYPATVIFASKINLKNK